MLPCDGDGDGAQRPQPWRGDDEDSPARDEPEDERRASVEPGASGLEQAFGFGFEAQGFEGLFRPFVGPCGEVEGRKIARAKPTKRTGGDRIVECFEHPGRVPTEKARNDVTARVIRRPRSYVVDLAVDADAVFGEGIGLL